MLNFKHKEKQNYSYLKGWTKGLIYYKFYGVKVHICTTQYQPKFHHFIKRAQTFLITSSMHETKLLSKTIYLTRFLMRAYQGILVNFHHPTKEWFKG